MQTLINLMEAIRFLSDHASEAHDEEGIPLISIGAKAVSVLVQAEEETDQRILLATMLHSFGSEYLSESEIKTVFGSRVLEYYRRSRNPESLRVEKLQRLVTPGVRIPLEAGRKILLANTIAKWAYSSSDTRKEEVVRAVEGFRHLYPRLEQQFKPTLLP